MRVLSTVPFTALRMIRNYIVLLLLLVVPMIILTVFSFVLSGVFTETGEPYIHVHATIMVLCFQLFGGSIVMHLIHSDLFSAHKIRMYALPFHQGMYAFSIMICGVMYSILQGICLMMYAQFVLGVVWAHWLWVIYMISLVAVLSIIVSLLFTFTISNFKLVERLNEVYGVGFIMLAGLFFPMPDNAFFAFMGSYGNPLTLSLLSIDAMNKSNTGEAWLLANILLGTVVILFLLLFVLGRRKIV